MGTKTESRKPVALFMAFGTKGDVYPISAIAAAFAGDQKQYHVVLVTHSAHEEGWSLAELFRIRCVVAAPYVVPYSAPSSFENHFRREHPLLYRYLQEADSNQVYDVQLMYELFNLVMNIGMDLAKKLLNVQNINDDLSLNCVSRFLCSMGFLRNPQIFLRVIQAVLEITKFRFILFTASYEPLDEAVQAIATEALHLNKRQYLEEGICLFDGRLFCFPGMVPYKWLFPRCAAAIHHGGSGSTAAALHAGIPQCAVWVRFYWAEKMYWIGVSPEPLNRSHLIPDKLDNVSIRMAANVLSRAINNALSPKVKARALEIAERISLECKCRILSGKRKDLSLEKATWYAIAMDKDLPDSDILPLLLYTSTIAVLFPNDDVRWNRAFFSENNC
ncbi:unnamed protein product [Dovyalis caffra]|uniref:Erythromycin biosynthesis protein CIII-like C-terminal domain-containing protein n=1 Tax=Dovyalis caffra TaxID=77055 RepID=A0AAV1SVF2_9ROSI|nr:unnamed protein product [Dovyalis caffra]